MAEVSFSMSVEDRERLRTLAEALRASESEVIARMIKRDYAAWEESLVADDGEGEDTGEDTGPSYA